MYIHYYIIYQHYCQIHCRHKMSIKPNTHWRMNLQISKLKRYVSVITLEKITIENCNQINYKMFLSLGGSFQDDGSRDSTKESKIYHYTYNYNTRYWNDWCFITCWALHMTYLIRITNNSKMSKTKCSK